MPFLIFNEMQFSKLRPTPAYLKVFLKGAELPHDGWGVNWVGIRRINLETGEDTQVLDQESLGVPPSYASGYVSRILSVSADGSGAVCVVGLMHGSQMKYFVYELSFDAGLGRKITELPNVFL
jgi:hypothetical protein